MFLDMLKNESSKKESTQPLREAKELLSEEKKPEEILRGAGFKIKLITPTSFGTQIDFAKQYEKEEIEKVLDGFNIKIKGKSVFVVN